MKAKNVYLWLFCSAVLIISLCAGCASSKPEEEAIHQDDAAVRAEEKAEINCFRHKVKLPGETISIIAGWYTGDIENWKELAAANPDLNPNLIKKGNVICIPKTMLTTRKAITKAYVDSFYPKKKQKVKPATVEEAPPEKVEEPPPAAEEQETELFGPK